MHYIKADSKASFRQISLQSLKNRTKKSNYALDKRANSSLTKLALASKARRILAYLPLQTEVNIMPTIRKLRAKKIAIFVPFIIDISFKMVPFRLPLGRGKFNLKHAGNTYRSVKKIDMAFVPTVGIDANFKRVGFGKGMYDKFFATYVVPLVLFVQRVPCICSTVITDKLDSLGDLLITGNKNYIQGYNKNDNRDNGTPGYARCRRDRVYGGKKDRSSQIRHLYRAIKI